MLDWRKHFPKPIPRQSQIDALDDIVKSFDSGARAHVAELGTGVGKSAVAVTLARLAQSLGKRTVILTSQKALQDQYSKEYATLIADLRSSSNFECEVGGGRTCGQTSRLRLLLPARAVPCKSCPYAERRFNFDSSPIGLTNYSFYLSSVTYGRDKDKPRHDIIVCDEAHNVEDEVRKWTTVTSSFDFVTKKLGLDWPQQNEDIREWFADEYKNALKKYFSKTKQKVDKAIHLDPTSSKMSTTKLVAELDTLDKHVCQLNRLTVAGVLDDTLVDLTNERVALIPLDVSQQIQETLYGDAKFVLFMTATGLDDSRLKRSLAVSNSTGYISRPSPFDDHRYGLKLVPCGKMSGGRTQGNAKMIVDSIKKILAAHPNEKGIIHANSYEIVKIVEQIKDRRLLIQRSGLDREDVLRTHLTSPDPTVIVSPGMTEGIDLRDDLGRFQVICKVPYPYLGDPVVAAKSKADSGWYAWRTITTLVQAAGRCVRSAEDSAATYILDECLIDVMHRWPKMFPDYWNSISM